MREPKRNGKADITKHLKHLPGMAVPDRQELAKVIADLAAQLETAAAGMAQLAELDAAIGKQQASQRVRDAVLLDALEALGAARSATEAAVKRAVVEAVASKAAPQREIASLAGVAFSTVQKWTQNGIDDRRRA